MRIYISGQITGLDINVAKDYFEQTAAQISAMGFTPLGSMELVPFHPDWKWEDYMLKDIEILFGADAIFMLENWKNSRGAKIERAIFEHCEKKIFYSLHELSK